MKNTFIITGIIFFCLSALSVVHACEPCSSALNFEETVEKADLIIIGQRTDFFPDEQNSVGPDSIDVKIIEILKGETNQNQITVNSYDGMCGYGIVVHNDKKYVMLLQEKDDIYDAIDFGCSVRTFPVDNDLVDFNGNKISIDEFTDKLSPQASRKIIDDETQKQIIKNNDTDNQKNIISNKKDDIDDDIVTQDNITNLETEKTKPEDSLLKRIWNWFLSLF